MFALWGYRGDLARVKYAALFKLAHYQRALQSSVERDAAKAHRSDGETVSRKCGGLGENEKKVQRAGQFLPLRQFVDLQRDREIFLTQIGRLGLELMLQLAQDRLVRISGFR